MGRWAPFLALALVTNTALGPPFDPVLLWYAGGRPWPESWAFVCAGAVCAGLAGVLEALLVARLGARRTGPPDRRTAGWRGGRAFYLFTAAISASPLPFTLVRVAALARRPHPLAYGAAIAVGRVPRYAVTVLLWHTFGLSNGVLAALGAAALAPVALRRLLRSPAGRACTRIGSAAARHSFFAAWRAAATLVGCDEPRTAPPGAHPHH